MSKKIKEGKEVKKSLKDKEQGEIEEEDEEQEGEIMEEDTQKEIQKYHENIERLSNPAVQSYQLLARLDTLIEVLEKLIKVEVERNELLEDDEESDDEADDKED
jgi:hypothetical protein